MHTLAVEGLGSELRLIRFEGHEGISELYQFEIDVVASENDISFADVVGKPAVLTLHVGDEPRHVHGIVSAFELGDEGKKLTAYRVTLVPEVWRLLHRRDSRIFQEMSTPDILKQVLSIAGVADVKLRLSGSYSPREYCVQYRESDWAFMCRLMEEEGIFYYFEHDAAKDLLVLGDGPGAHDPIAGAATLPFRAPLGALVKDEHVSRFRYRERVRPGKVTLRDYNFKKPTLGLESTNAGSIDSDLEIYDYPGDYDAPGPGDAIAKSRLEMFQATKKTGEGESACPRFTPGYKFTLGEHAREDLNVEYILTRVRHHGSDPHMETSREAAPYGNTFEVIPATVPFRPDRVTPWPTIKGVQTAIVTGPGGDEIYTDEHGRIKVQFHWDRLGKKDDHSSCWIRVSQIWAGGAWGAVFIPRIGHEVVVDFLEGDPDRPLVVGSVYHGANVPPYPLPGEKTKSTIKSNSSLGGGGSNEFRYEDKKGSEEIFLHAQKDWNIVVENDKTQEIGHDETLHVVHNRKKTVDCDQSEKIGLNKTIEVGASHTETILGVEAIVVGAAASRSVGGAQVVKVGAQLNVSSGGDHKLEVGKKMTVSIGDLKEETVAKSSAETVKEDKKVTVDGSYKIAVKKTSAVTIDEDSTTHVKGDVLETVDKKITIHCGDTKVVVDKDGKIMIEGKDLDLKIDGPVKMNGKKFKVKSDGTIDIEAGGAIKIKGSGVNIN